MIRSRISFARRGLVAISLLFVTLVYFSAHAHGQATYTPGAPVVSAPVAGLANMALSSSPMYLDATQFSSTAPTVCSGNPTPLTNDAAGQIQAAICASASGGTIDARGFAGTSPVFGSNPFADPVNTDLNGTDVTTKPVTLLLPSGVIIVNATIGISKQTNMYGQGSLATVLQMGSSFPGYSSNTEITNNCGAYQSGTGPHCFPIICMGVGGGPRGTGTGDSNAPFIWVASPPQGAAGNSCETPNSMYGVHGSGTISNNPRIKLAGFQINANPSTGSGATTYGVGIQNITAEEKSTVTNVSIIGFSNGGRGINVANTGQQANIYANNMQNSGPYTDLEINWGPATGFDCSAFTAPTYGIFVANGPTVTVGVGGHITLNGGACSLSGTPYSGLIGIDASGPGVKVGGTVHCENYYDCVRLGSSQAVIGGSVDNITAAGNTQNDVEIQCASGCSNHVLAAISHLYGFNTSPGNTVNCIVDNQASVTVSSGTLGGGGCNYYEAGLSGDPETHFNPVVTLLNGLMVSRVQTTGSPAPACIFSSGGGLTPSCTLDTGSTDSAGIIIAETGSTTPAGTGTITLTFSSALGTHNPSCIFMASDNGTGAWNGLAVMKDKTPTTTSDLFTWTNGTTPTALLVTKTYWINYHCWAK